MKKNKIIFRNLFYISLLFVLNACSEKKQNVVFILVDDLGWTDLGYMGSTFYETPNIDLLSQVSFQFSNAYSSGSVCSPSRAAILTGKHPARINITDWIPGLDPKDEKLLGPVDLNELPLEETTLAEAFKNNGYKTFFAGKWHLGSIGFLPQNQGFVINKGGHHRGQPPGGYYSPYKNPNLSDGPDGEYLTDRLTNESVKFIEENKNQPFFLFLPYYTVHTPIEASKKHIEKFNKKLEQYEIKEKPQKAEGRGVTRQDQLNPAYASMVYALDENIGKLIAKLKSEGLYENTTIIFTSDNGGLSTLHKKHNSKGKTSVLPLRGGKGWLYEGGIRVPLLIKPAEYTKGSKLISTPVIGHDFYPTLISMTDLESPKNTQIDGLDITPLLNGEKQLDRNEFFWHFPHYHNSGWTPGAAIRQDQWKLIEFYENGTSELYNLDNDISERIDLSSKHPDKARALKKRLHDIQKSMNANKTTLNINSNTN